MAQLLIPWEDEIIVLYYWDGFFPSFFALII